MIVREVIALSLTFFFAGFFLGWIVLPQPLGRTNRLFLSMALAVPATLLAAAPWVATHTLVAWNVSLGMAALAALAAWRGRTHLATLPERLRHARKPGRPRLLPTLLIALALIATWLTVLVPEGVEDTGSGRPNGTIVYYHWGIVGRVVEAGGLPATLPEWGKQREFPYEYAFSVIHGASTADLADDSGFVLEERYRIAMVICAFFAFFALWSRWLPSWWAWLATILSMNVSRIDTRLLVYKPEAFAFVLVVWSTWLFDEALERRSLRWGALAGLVLASSFLAHPVGSLLVAPLWGGVILGRACPWLCARWRYRRGRGGGLDWASIRGAVPWRALASAALVFVVLFGGLRTIIGTTGQELSQSKVAGVDETRVVYNLAYVSANPFAQPRVPECNQPFGVYSTVRPFFSSHASWFYFDIHARSSIFLMIGALVLIGGAFLWQAPPRLSRLPASLKRALITWSLFGIGVYLLAVLICVYYSTWVPQRVGPMRLMPYWALIFPIFLAAVGWGAARLLTDGGSGIGRLKKVLAPRLDGWMGAGVAVVPALLVSAAAIWTFTTISATQDRGVPAFYISEPRAGGLSQGALDSYQWISENLPSNALVLANGYTEGALGMLSRRTGLLDGRTPFAQPNPWRAEAIRWLGQARAFFLSPTQTEVPGNAGYVLVAKQSVNLGGSYFPTDFAAVERDRSLEKVYSFEGVTIYRVDMKGGSTTRKIAGTPRSFVYPERGVHRNLYKFPVSEWASFLKRTATGDAPTELQPSC
jgi:hypothetical protein